MELLNLLLLAGFGSIGYLALRKDIQSLKPKKKPSIKKIAGDEPERVYILANPSYRNGLFKIGLTKRTINTRIRELFTTGVPTPFSVCAVLNTSDCAELEKKLHRMWADNRVNPKREWFEMTQKDLDVILSPFPSDNYIVHFSDQKTISQALTGSWGSFKYSS